MYANNYKSTPTHHHRHNQSGYVPLISSNNPSQFSRDYGSPQYTPPPSYPYGGYPVQTPNVYYPPMYGGFLPPPSQGGADPNTKLYMERQTDLLKDISKKLNKREKSRGHERSKGLYEDELDRKMKELQRDHEFKMKMMAQQQMMENFTDQMQQKYQEKHHNQQQDNNSKFEVHYRDNIIDFQNRLITNLAGPQSKLNYSLKWKED